jgi:hypothetical protein
MSDSHFVCWRDGLPVASARDGWRHALGGKTGSIPPSTAHKPVPIPREEYELAFAGDTPREVAYPIFERMRRSDKRINGDRARGQQR